MSALQKRILYGLGVASALYALFYWAVLPNLGQARRFVALQILAPDIKRGEVILRQGGCVVCHTDKAGGGGFLTGGTPLKTPFGTFYGPNITPDPEHGIGGMSLQEFFDAMTAGVSPEGEHYYPAFPYTSYATLDVADIVDLKAYLDTVPPFPKPNKPHDVSWPFSDRKFLGFWKALNHEAKPFEPNARKSPEWNRGAYLVNGPGHCGECHTSRNLLGGLSGAKLAGSSSSGSSPGAPSILGARSTIRDWSPDDLVFYLRFGLTPSGDVSGGKMIDVIEQGTSLLEDEDLSAIAHYLLDL